MIAHLENEAALLAEARAGDAGAFTTLVNQYDRHIYRLALNVTSNREDAEDVLQETFLKAYTHLGDFRGDSRFYTWLVRIATNEALMKLRKRGSGKEVSLDEPVETDDQSLMPREIEDWGDDPEQRHAKAELQRVLTEVVEKLETGLRVVFVLRDVEDLSTEETAAALGLSVAAVKSRLLRARLRMRERLSVRFSKGYKG